MPLAETAAVAVCILVPGAAVTAALWRMGELGVASFLGLSFGIGYAVNAAAAFVLAVVGWLRPETFLPLIAVTTLIAGAKAAKRSSFKERSAALVADIRNEPWAVLPGLLVVAGTAVTRASYAPIANLNLTSPWRYWADAMEIADRGGFHEVAVHYGLEFPPTVSKALLNSFNAAMTFVAGHEPLPAMGAILFVLTTGIAAVAWSLGRELGLRHVAPLLPILILINRLLVFPATLRPIRYYVAENVGLLVSLTALTVAVKVTRGTGGHRYIALGSLLIAVAMGTHLVPLVVVLSALGWYVLATAFVSGGRTAILLRAGVMVVAGIVLGSFAPRLSGGDIGLQGVADPGLYRDIEARYPALHDPSWFLSTGVVNQPAEYEPELRQELYGGWYDPPGPTYERFIRTLTRRDDPGDLTLWIPVAGLVLAIVMLFALPRELKPLGLMGWGVGLSLIVITLYFLFMFETSVPARFGVRRMFDYAPLVPILVGLPLLEAALRALARIKPWIPAVAAALLVTVVSIVWIPQRWLTTQNLKAERGVEALDWIRANVPCDARMLVSRRTAGTFQAASGRVSITEGMTPFLRPAVLEEVIDVLVGAATFFREPRGNRSFLQLYEIDYVVHVKEGVNIGGETSHMRMVDERGLRTARFLRKMGSAGRVDFYEVTRQRSPTKLPDAEGRPGWTCYRDRVETL